VSRHWGLNTLLSGATTDDLYHVLAEVMTVLDDRGQLDDGFNRIQCEYAEIRKDKGDDRWFAVYYAEGSAELAMEDRGQGVAE
jgi:hypothetical protein